MKNNYNLTAIIEREETMYETFSREIDVVSQGNTVEEARKNLKEAIEFFKCASGEEILERYPNHKQLNNS